MGWMSGRVSSSYSSSSGNRNSCAQQGSVDLNRVRVEDAGASVEYHDFVGSF